jgi:protein-L-isoaspartate(D-aspartate) O-methyltransferase
MVERQLRGRGIRDERVLAAMGLVARELFVPDDQQDDSYRDNALPIDSGQSISQPYIVARMTELLEPRPDMRVLEVGTGSGYQAAILATIGCRVVSIERHADLAEAARARLDELGMAEQVRVEVGDGSLGWPADAPFEGIIVTAAAAEVPASLRAQLADGGRLVIPVGPPICQELVQLVRRGEVFETHRAGACVFVPLVGVEGYADEETGRSNPRRWLGVGRRP